jgi:hypothetical protein
MKDRKKPGVAFWATIAAALALALSAYVRAYAWLATPGRPLINDAHHIREPILIDVPVHYECRSTLIRRREAEIARLFAPIHRIDRRLRPEKWTRKVVPRDETGGLPLVAWTRYAIGRRGSVAEFFNPDQASHDRFLTLPDRFEKRLAGEVGMESIDWLWDELEVISKHGPRYCAHYRPTTPERLAEADHVKIGPDVP